MFGLSANSDDSMFICPRCGGEEYSLCKLPNVLFVHWVLNPGLVFNELLFGQRIPARLYTCNLCPGPTWRRQYVHCPGCGQYHDGMIWAKGHAFGHWLGIVCPDCGSRIPSLLNVTSWLVLARVSPISWLLWWWFGERYQAFEQRRAYRAREELEAGRRDQEFR